MAAPLSPSTTYAASSTPSIKSQDLNDLEQFVYSGIYSAQNSIKALTIDGVGGVSSSPAAAQLVIGQTALADTHLQIWRDQLGKVKGVVDHLGYRRGRMRELYIDWLELGVGNVAGSGATVQSGKLTYTLPTNANIAAQASTGNAPGGGYLAFTTANVANATTMRLITPPVWGPATIGSLVVEFDINLSVPSAVDWKIGFVNTGSFGAQTCTGTPNSSEHAFALVKQAADTNWFLETAINGTGFTKTDTTLAASSITYRVLMELHGSASPYGSLCRVWMNDVKVIDSTPTNIPITTLAGFSFVVAGTTTSATNSASIFVSPVRAIWNAWALSSLA